MSEARQFRQGAVTGGIEVLVEQIRADEPVVAEPGGATAWDEKVARRWASECVGRLLEKCGTEEDEARPLYFAVSVARQYAEGKMTYDVLEGARGELDAEEWPAYLPPGFHAAVAAAKLATTLETGGGTWAAEAARAAADAVAAFGGDRAAERAWQAERLAALLAPKIA